MAQELILPHRFRELKWSNQIEGNLKSLLLDYIENFGTYYAAGKAPALFGKSGTGKSYCSALVALELEKKLNVGCLWVPTVEALNILLDLRDFRKESYFIKKSHILESQFIVMDDFGQLRDFPRIRELFFEIVDHRYAAQRPTMFTANFTASSTKELEGEIAKCFNEALARRIMAMSEGLVYSS